MMTVSGVIGSASSTVWGSLADRYGRLRPLLFIIFLRGIAFLLLAWSVWHKSGFIVFAGFYIFSGVLGTGLFPITDAIVSDVTTREKRVEVFGIMRVVMNMSWALGPAVGGLLVQGGYHWLFVATSISLLISGIVAVIRLRETHPPEKRTGADPADNNGTNGGFAPYLKDTIFMQFLAIAVLIFLVKGQLVATISVHSAETVGLGKGEISILYFLNGACVAIFQLAISRLVARRNPLLALAFSGILYSIGYAVVGFAGGFPTMITAMLIITSGELFEAPTTSAYVANLAPARLSGTYMGAFNMVLHLGWTIGPLLGGILTDKFANPTHMWMVISGMALTASFGFLMLYRKRVADH